MTPERWKQVKQLFNAALEHEPNERTAFLAQSCANDNLLREEVESLLGSHLQAGSFIEAPASDVAAALIAEDREPVTDRKVGNFKVSRVLGTAVDPRW